VRLVRVSLGLCSLAVTALSCSTRPVVDDIRPDPAETDGGMASPPPNTPAAPAEPQPTPGQTAGEDLGTPSRIDEGGASGGSTAAADAGTPATSDAGSASAVVSTGGRGGPTGAAELRSSGGLQYRINAPADAGPHGLLVLLHGSTASNYEQFVPMMATVAERYDLIPVSVLAPNGQGWNEGNQVNAAELLHALVQEDLFTQYDIDTSRVLFSGQSSGGGFLASNFVPAHAQDYTGGAFFQCGAAPPNIRFSPDAVTRESFRLHFEITTEDPIWPESYAATLVAYRDAAMNLTEDSTKPGGHCQFDQQQVILDHIEFVLGR
jgi:predicted esterase